VPIFSTDQLNSVGANFGDLPDAIYLLSCKLEGKLFCHSIAQIIDVEFHLLRHAVGELKVKVGGEVNGDAASILRR
jgi:hypothetical protein